MNEVILIGRLTKDPAFNNTGNPRTKFTIAVDRERYNGEDNGADFIRITCWMGLAEACNKYLKKGNLVAVKGRIRTDSFKGDNSEDVYIFEIVASQIKFLSTSN